MVLVGRELCLYLLVDGSRVPARQRAEFLSLAVRRAAPFADPEFDVLWLRDHAAVWYWSRGRARESSGRRDARYRAEALFRGDVAAGDAEQLLELDVSTAAGDTRSAGVDARIWRQGKLQASRWWPQVPDPRDWATFVRGAGLPASTPIPGLQPAPLRDRALSPGAGRGELGGQLSQRVPVPLLAGTVAVLVGALLSWQAAGVARAMWSTHLAEGWIAQLSARMEKIISARERADAAQARIDALMALRTPASQTRLLGEVKRLTPGNWEMVDWSQASPELLEVTFVMPNADVAAIVAAWEGSPLFQGVTPASGRQPDQVVLQARLTPLLEQAP